MSFLISDSTLCLLLERLYRLHFLWVNAVSLVRNDRAHVADLLSCRFLQYPSQFTQVCIRIFAKDQNNIKVRDANGPQFSQTFLHVPLKSSRYICGTEGSPTRGAPMLLLLRYCCVPFVCLSVVGWVLSFVPPLL